MQNNLRNRSVALASTFALALSGVVALAPAASAVSAVELKPKAGVNLGAFITDDFEMSVNVPVTVPEETLAIKIDNPAKEHLRINLSGFGASGTGVTVRAFNAVGTEISMATSRFGVTGGSVSFIADRGNVVTGSTGRLDIAFDGSATTPSDATVNADITSIVLTDIKMNPAGAALNTSLDLGVQVRAASDDFAWGDGNQGDITVQAWVETEPTPDYTSVDSSTASSSATVKFYDPAGVSIIPSIERFDTRLMNNDEEVVGKVRFIRPDLNLDQVDLSNFDLTVRDTAGNVVEAAQSLNSIRVDKAGFVNKDDSAGAIYFDAGEGVDNHNVNAASSYTVRVAHNSTVTTNTRTFNSTGYTPATNSADRDLYITVTDSDNAEQDNTAPVEGGARGVQDSQIELRPGTAAFTYNARLYTSDSVEREKVASQVVIATVTAGSFMPTGTEYTVSGSNETLAKAGQATVVSGLTDSNGDFAVTVTSSNPVAATSYDVKFNTIDSDGALRTDVVGTSGTSTMAATYTAAGVDGTALTVANSVLAGASITASASVKDTYGVLTNLNGSDALYVTIQATDTDDLNETVAVSSNGSASFTFDNYVESGQSDLLTMYLHEGSTYTSGTTTIIDSEVLSIYNPGAVTAVNVPASTIGNITYDDFITGAASSTNVAPNDNEISVTGTVVDANGQGIPGAVVTVDADGMQLRKSGVGNYAQDSITFAASASGAFTVDMWSHVVDITGVDVTFTSGGVSSTTTVSTYLPETGVNGNVLVFGLDTPDSIMVNTTYAMKATLADKWGNPIATSAGTSATAVSIVGTGSVEINSDSTGVDKNFGRDGSVTVFVRSIKDIEGPGAITATLSDASYTTHNGTAVVTGALSRAEISTDVAGTVWDETAFSNEIEVDVNVGTRNAATSGSQKVNAGSFKGYVAVYALGYEGQRLSAKIGNDWVIVDPIVNNESANLARVTDFTGAGYDIAVRIYIDRVLIDTINLTTK